MTTADQLNAIHLDWANGKVTLADALREAYGLGMCDGWDRAKLGDESECVCEQHG